jgi:FkbM family methyltransferase
MRTVFPDHVENSLKAEFFGQHGGGYFVEVGANEPQRGSQTWQFEQAGWSGILVEPQPDLAERLRQTRRAHVVSAACSSKRNAGGTLRLYLSGPHSSLSRDLAITGVVADKAIDVPVRTLDDILEEAAAPAPIDFVSIDVEGHEVEVLSGFDLARWGLNGWYVPQPDAPRVGLGWWQIARKYYLALPFRMLRDRKRRLRDRLGARRGQN